MLKKITLTCMAVILLTASPVFAVMPSSQLDSEPNCPEGYFHKLTGPSLSSHNNTCYNLYKPEFGFRQEEFPQINNIITPNCNLDDIKAAINNAPNTGTIINIPECTLTVSNTQLEIDKDNLVIQGSGIGITNINATGRDNAFQSLFNIKNSTNVIIRDMSIQGNNKEVIGVNVENSSNILVERIHFRNGRIGVRAPTTSKFTVRYVDSYYTTYHGISAKDCSETNSVCNNRSNNFSVYSSTLGGGGRETELGTGNGIDLHSETGEVAGIYSYKNGSSNKFPDARNIWIHNNTFEQNNNDTWSLRTYSIIKDPVENMYIFSNTFKDNKGTHPMVIYEGPASNINNTIYLIDNNYQGLDSNKNNYIQKSGINFKVCANTQDVSRTPENIREVVSGNMCNLPNQIQPLDSNPTPTNPTPTVEPTEPTPSPSIDLSFDHTGDGIVDIRDILELVKYIFR